MQFETNESTITQICAVVDCQGFMLGRDFYVRELSIEFENGGACLPVRTGLRLSELSSKQQRQIRYESNNIHGLSLEEPESVSSNGLINQSDVPTVLHAWLAVTINPAEHYFACKNYQLARIMEKAGISCINLDRGSIKVPSLMELDAKFGHSPWFCAHHHNLPTNKIKRNTLRCASRKTTLLKAWINNHITEMKKKATFGDVLGMKKLTHELEDCAIV